MNFSSNSYCFSNYTNSDSCYSFSLLRARKSDKYGYCDIWTFYLDKESDEDKQRSEVDCNWGFKEEWLEVVGCMAVIYNYPELGLKQGRKRP